MKESSEKATALEDFVQKLSEEKEKHITQVDQYKNECKKAQNEKHELGQKLDENAKILENVRFENEKQSRQIKRITEENDALLSQVDVLDHDLQNEKKSRSEEIQEKNRLFDEQSTIFQKRLQDKQKVIAELNAKIEAETANFTVKLQNEQKLNEELKTKLEDETANFMKKLQNEQEINTELRAELEATKNQKQEEPNQLPDEIRQMNEELTLRQAKICNQEETIQKLTETVISNEKSFKEDLQNEQMTAEKLHQEIEAKNRFFEEQSTIFQQQLQDKQKVIAELNAKIESETANYEEKLQNEQKINAELKAKIEASKDPNELLDEIRQMNEELMLRGTKISAQEETIQNLKETVITLEKSIKEAQDEVAHLKDQSLNAADDSRSEIMSTSTVSRVEESSRMADLESSFEDRYSKLKIIAIKLKKKVHEQDKQINELQAENKHSEKLSQLTSNFANLQCEYDKAQDAIETQTKEISQLSKDLKSSIDNLTETKLKCTGLEDELNSVKITCQKYETDFNELSGLHAKSVEDLKQFQQIKEENVALKSDLENTKSQIDSLTKKNKKQDLLDLELEEAETRIASLTG